MAERGTFLALCVIAVHFALDATPFFLVVVVVVVVVEFES